jgi:hypothetical protein
MPDKPKRAAARPADQSADLSAAVKGLTDVVQSLAQAVQLMQQMMHGLAQGPPPPAAPAAATTQINAWENDPFSEETPTDNPPLATPIQIPTPDLNDPLLGFKIDEPGPAPALFPPGSANFRYWAAREALTRGIMFWRLRLPPGTRWTTDSSPLTVTLVAGEDLNANYSRQSGLRFYQQTVRGKQIFSGESSDVSCHELGHAILDALKPELWDAASTEVAAFHESFGDMSAILSALQVPSLCQKVIQETGGRLNVNSRLSRLAAQLGWAIRQLSPTAVDRDCLRNAANRFFYEDPDSLPPQAPASQLSSEVHSFSRVFTGAFLDALARVLNVVGPATVPNLQAVSHDLGQLLVDAVRLAPVTAGYYSQVAAAMLQADQARFGARYRSALSSGFVEHGILSPDAVAALKQAQTPRMEPPPPPPAGMAAVAGAAGSRMPTFGDDNQGYRRTAADAPELPRLQVTTASGWSLEVHAPGQPARFAVASAALGVGQTPARSAQQEARAFVEDLIQLGRIDFEPARTAVAAELMAPHARASKKTHTVVLENGQTPVLKRLHFNCGCGCCRAGR